MRLPDRVARARRLLASVEKNFLPAVFESRFGAEDMVVLDLIARDGLGIPVVLVDTGLLARETHALVARVRKDYGIEVGCFRPWPGSLDAHLEQYGERGLLDGAEAREASRAIREQEPLRRALAGKRAWITAMRRERSSAPGQAAESVHYATHRLWRFNPLLDWSADDVRDYLDANRVPSVAAIPPSRAFALRSPELA